MKPNDRFPEIRDGVRALCRDFPDDYFRKIDAEHVLGLPRSF